MKRKHRFWALCNIALSLILAAHLWYRLGCPMPTEAMELRRYQQQTMTDNSLVTLWESPAEGIQVLDNKDIYVHSVYGDPTIWKRNGDTATLVVLPTFPLSFLAVDLPEEAQAAQLTVTLDMGDVTSTLGDDIPATYVMESQRNGMLFHFALQPQFQTGGDVTLASLENVLLNNLSRTLTPSQMKKEYPYILEFFDTEGKLIETVTNS